MAAGVVGLSHDVEEKRLHIIVQGFMVQKKLGE